MTNTPQRQSSEMGEKEGKVQVCQFSRRWHCSIAGKTRASHRDVLDVHGLYSGCHS